MAVATAKRELVAAKSAEVEKEELVVEELQAALLERLEAAYEEAKASWRPEIAAPTRWWDIMAIGPFSAPVDLGFPKPNPIVRVGQRVVIFSVLFLNPFGPPPPSPMRIIGGALLPYRIMYDTTNVTTVSHDATLSGTVNGNLAPVPFILNAITLTPNAPGLYEVNLRAQILTAMNTTMVPFAGYASRVDSIHASIFGPDGLVIRFEQPVRFDAYV
ncbi:MAG: hypothetical protein J7455_14410 [Roseiflexus sp.]|jgi:hypothetical protein|nr:hypothetical protein [Roseiflexus sp.]MBO9364919.1 hypothetical protein [Roseiflexus sp.]MBO9382096.1 hypothetical protein [Roseiflexus sp.]MBO9390002.1 hypothetical protein [Roseiflexus sp.]